MKRLKPGTKLYLPSTEGIALIAEILEESMEDYLIEAGGIKQYVSKDTVKSHGIVLPDKSALVYITQRLEDPENKIVYLRYVYTDTIIDKLYNYYSSKKLSRPDRVVMDNVK